MNASAQTLAGKTIIITRPADRGKALSEMIETAGGTAVHIPVLEILPPANPAEIQPQLQALKDFDIAVFVSANAVNGARVLLAPNGLPDTLTPAAIGRSTADALKAWGFPAGFVPTQEYGSESLLALDALNQVKGKQVAIIQGGDGRNLLEETLVQRGAEVSCIDVYRRATAFQQKHALLDALNKNNPILTATSTQSLESLLEIGGDAGKNNILNAPLVVLSERIQAFARSIGFKNNILVAAERSDSGILDTLREYPTA